MVQWYKDDNKTSHTDYEWTDFMSMCSYVLASYARFLWDAEDEDDEEVAEAQDQAESQAQAQAQAHCDLVKLAAAPPPNLFYGASQLQQPPITAAS